MQIGYSGVLWCLCAFECLQVAASWKETGVQERSEPAHRYRRASAATERALARDRKTARSTHSSGLPPPGQKTGATSCSPAAPPPPAAAPPGWPPAASAIAAVPGSSSATSTFWPDITHVLSSHKRTACVHTRTQAARTRSPHKPVHTGRDGARRGSAHRSPVRTSRRRAARTPRTRCCASAAGSRASCLARPAQSFSRPPVCFAWIINTNGIYRGP